MDGSGAQRQVAEGRELGEALTFQAKGARTTLEQLCLSFLSHWL